MDDRRGDQGFAVVTQSVVGGPGRGRKGPRRIGVAIVAVASLALVTVGFVGPRLNGLPNFDIAYFATPTPRATPRPTPTPTPTRPGATPAVTPLPTLTRPDDVPPLDGDLVLAAGDSIQRFDLATGETTRVQPMTLWQDAVTIDPDGRIVCVCIENGGNERGPTRTVRLVRITGEAAVTSELATFESSPDALNQQPDPLIDVVLDRASQSGLLAVVTRTRDDWRVSVRAFDARNGATGPEIPLGRIVIPALPRASPSPTATPDPGLGQPDPIYIDGPHVRLAPDGRTAFVWASGQRYTESDPPPITHGGWRIRFDPSGAVQDVAEAPGLASMPDYCSGWTFTGPDRFAALCVRPDNENNIPASQWDLRVLDTDGRTAGTIPVPGPREYGWGEPLADQANGRVYLWDPIQLSVVRIDVAAGSVASATFDPAAASAPGVTSGAAGRSPAWHDGDSAVQQFLFETLSGPPEGTRLFAVGYHPDSTSDVYTQRSYGVFVIDPATLALVQHWAPVTNDTWVAPIAGDRVVVGGQPGMNAEGQQVPWLGSLTVRQAADGRILARYGDVSTDMPPVLVRP